MKRWKLKPEEFGPHRTEFYEYLKTLRKQKYQKEGSMSFIDLLRDIRNSFDFKKAILNRVGDYREDYRFGCNRKICERGIDQCLCLKAHIEAWRKTGTTQNYCWHCWHIFRMTSYDTQAGCTTECALGHWRQEAT